MEKFFSDWEVGTPDQPVVTIHDILPGVPF